MALVNQAGRAGSWTDAAFEPIFRRYHPRVLSSLARQVRQPEVAKELAQEVMMNLFKAPRCFDSLAGFETWLTAVSQNVVRNHWRGLAAQKRQGREVPEDELAGKPAQQLAASGSGVPPVPDPLAEVLRLEQTATIAKALAQLPAGMRNVAVLRYRQDRGYDEIARLLGVSVNTVKSQLHEAKKRLAELLGEHGGD